MKPVFKCDYCSFMGTEEEVREHESECRKNYNLKSCYTCIHKGKLLSIEDNFKYECKNGKDIPVGSVYKYCDMYERNQEKDVFDMLNIFSGFGGNPFGGK